MRIGIFLEGNYIKNYEVEEIKNLLKTKNKFIFFIFNSFKRNPKKFSLGRLLFFHKFYSLVLAERKIAGYFRKKFSYKKKIDELNKKIPIYKVVSNFNKYQKYNFRMRKLENAYIFDRGIQKIIKKKCDVCILLGFNKVIHAKMLNITKKGILSFHTADTNFYRGRPPGFYEFIDNVKYGGVTLQRLSKDLDRGEIIFKKKVNIQKSRSLDETLYMMMKLKKNMLINGIKKISKNQKFKKPVNSRLNLEIESKKLGVVLQCLKKTIYRRYFI